MSKSIYDFAAVKSVRAWVLVHPSEPLRRAGTFIAHYSDGGTCTVQLYLDLSLIKPDDLQTLGLTVGDSGSWVTFKGKAGGYGYDKLSGALVDALRNGGVPHTGYSAFGLEHANGETRRFFERLGFTVLEAIG